MKKKLMKKKTKKRMLETLAIAAFALQAAEFGMEVWKKVKSKKQRSGILDSANGHSNNSMEHKIIVPA